MKNIFKLLFVSLLIPLFITSCREDDYSIKGSPEASFKLYDTSLGSNVLYPSMENNTFRLVWDPGTGTSQTYKVILSATEDFKTPITFGTTKEHTFTSTVGNLNNTLLQAGFSPYGAQRVYFRIEVSGTAATSLVSNAISFDVTPYPVDKPVITSPTSGQSIILNPSSPTAVAAVVKWNDYGYGVAVNYVVEIAKAGSADFQVAGSTVNTKELSWTNFALNDAALKLNLAVGVSSDVQIRVTATTASAGGTITKTSDIVTFKVTPYQPAYVNFYIVGEASAIGWNAANAQKLNQKDQISEIYTYLEQGKDFRFLGQQAWDPLNYSLNDSSIRADYRYFNTWSSNLQPSGTDNMKFTGNSGVYKITIDQNSRNITIVPSSSPTLPTNVYLVGNIQGWNAGSAIPMTQVGDGEYEYTIAIPDGGEFKFLGQQDWSGLEWGNIHAAGNSGFLGPNGDNNNIKYDGTGGLYKITANVKLGTYKVTPQ